MLNYKLIQIYTSENASYRGVSLHSAVLDAVRNMKIAARCFMVKGQAGCYENGAFSTTSLEVFSYNLPLKIEIVVPSAESEAVLRKLSEMVKDGIVSAADLPVVSHKVGGCLIPDHLLVCDVMSASPKTAAPTTPLSEVAKALLGARFNSLPVIDSTGIPVGIVTQGDLISKGGLPLSLGLLSSLAEGQISEGMKSLDGKKAGDVMSSPAITARADSQLATAVELMIGKGLKRLPVVNEDGVLVGMLSRVDIFKTITASVDSSQPVETLGHAVKKVKDIMRLDVHAVHPDASIEEVMGVIDENDLHRVAVVDDAGKLLGIISDRDLFRLFGHKVSLWDRIAGRLTFTEMGRRHRELVEFARKSKASELMQTNHVAVSEEAGIDEAIKLMGESSIKRLPVIDSQGVFKGMVSRDSILRLCLH